MQLMAPSISSTARLILRPFEPDDAARIESLIDDIDVARMLSKVPHPYPQGAAAEFITQSRTSRDVCALCLKSGELIGCISAWQEQDETYVGYWLGKAYWEQGYMYEGLSAFLHRLFAPKTLRKIKAGVFADNVASQRLQEKLGFRRTGETLRFSLARGHDVPLIETELSREDFLDLEPRHEIS